MPRATRLPPATHRCPAGLRRGHGRHESVPAPLTTIARSITTKPSPVTPHLERVIPFRERRAAPHGDVSAPGSFQAHVGLGASIDRKRQPSREPCRIRHKDHAISRKGQCRIIPCGVVPRVIPADAAAGTSAMPPATADVVELIRTAPLNRIVHVGHETEIVSIGRRHGLRRKRNHADASLCAREAPRRWRSRLTFPFAPRSIEIHGSAAGPPTSADFPPRARPAR